jgi:hypothetical protein
MEDPMATISNALSFFVRFSKKSSFPYICLWALSLFIYTLLPYIADDVFDRNIIAISSSANMLAYLKTYFWTMGSRIIVICLHLLLLKFRILFLIIGPLAFAWAAYLINYFFNPTGSKKIAWLICALSIIFPFYDLGTAGYVVDTAGYLIPFTLMLFAFIPLKKLAQHEPIKPIEYVLYALAMVYAANIEQFLVIIFPILVLFIILKNDRTNFFVYIEFFIVIAMMFFAFLTPGNYARLTYDARV